MHHHGVVGFLLSNIVDSITITAPEMVIVINSGIKEPMKQTTILIVYPAS